MITFLKKILGVKFFQFNTKASTIPEAFNYSLEEYDHLVQELTNLINTNDKLNSLASYIQSPYFASKNMDLNNPNHAFLFGYALTSAILIRRNIEMQERANEVLKQFNPIVENNPTKKAIRAD